MDINLEKPQWILNLNWNINSEDNNPLTKMKSALNTFTSPQSKQQLQQVSNLKNKAFDKAFELFNSIKSEKNQLNTNLEFAVKEYTESLGDMIGSKYFLASPFRGNLETARSKAIEILSNNYANHPVLTKTGYAGSITLLASASSYSTALTLIVTWLTIFLGKTNPVVVSLEKLLKFPMFGPLTGVISQEDRFVEHFKNYYKNLSNISSAANVSLPTNMEEQLLAQYQNSTLGKLINSTINSFSIVDVAVAVTEPINLSELTNIFDNVEVSVGEFILVNGQSNKKQNGIYEVIQDPFNGSYAIKRATKYKNEMKSGMFYRVKSGTKKERKFKLVSSDPIISGTSDIEFEEDFNLFDKFQIESDPTILNVPSGEIEAGAIYEVIGYDSIKYNNKEYFDSDLFKGAVDVNYYIASGTGKVVKRREPNFIEDLSSEGIDALENYDIYDKWIDIISFADVFKGLADTIKFSNEGVSTISNIISETTSSIAHGTQVIKNNFQLTEEVFNDTFDLINNISQNIETDFTNLGFNVFFVPPNKGGMDRLRFAHSEYFNTYNSEFFDPVTKPNLGRNDLVLMLTIVFSADTQLGIIPLMNKVSNLFGVNISN